MPSPKVSFHLERFPLKYTGLPRPFSGEGSLGPVRGSLGIDPEGVPQVFGRACRKLDT